MRAAAGYFTAAALLFLALRRWAPQFPLEGMALALLT